jgi:hypothetical protein
MQMRLVCLERIAHTRLEQQVLVRNELNLLQANDLEAAFLQVLSQSLQSAAGRWHRGAKTV